MSGAYLLSAGRHFILRRTVLHRLFWFVQRHVNRCILYPYLLWCILWHIQRHIYQRGRLSLVSLTIKRNPS